jgi:RNA polymerase sigma factor (TIGR02999 family)
MNGDITALLQAWRDGNKAAEAALANQIYPVLRRLAASRLRQSQPMTWQPTDLVGEAYESLFGNQRAQFQNRGHFLAIAARVMRRLIADHFRERYALKRGGDITLASLDELGIEQIGPARSYTELVEMDRVLQELAAIDPRGAEIVELRYFAGLSVPEAADALGLSERTVKRSWQFARAWLHERLDHAGGED